VGSYPLGKQLEDIGSRHLVSDIASTTHEGQREEGTRF